MSDLIERSKAVDLVRKMQTYKLSADDDLFLVNQAKVMMELMLLPPVVPKMVKCGDCRWNDGTAYCEFHYRAVKGDDFCSWGEKK